MPALYIRISDELHTRLKTEADKRGMSLQAFCSHLLLESLDNLLPTPRRLRLTKEVE